MGHIAPGKSTPHVFSAIWKGFGTGSQNGSQRSQGNTDPTAPLVHAARLIGRTSLAAIDLADFATMEERPFFWQIEP